MDGLSTHVLRVDEDLQSPEVQVAAALTASASALVTGPDGTGAALLRVVAAQLASSRTRVLRIGPPLDLPGFLDQVARTGGAAGDTGLEQGFAALTDPGPSCDRIALLVEDAHLMPDATLRYIEFALHAGPHLCVAFAGQPGIADTLGLPGYAGLRRRLSLRLALPPAQAATAMAALPAAPAAALPVDAAPVRRRRRSVMVWRELAGAALAAGVAVLLWPHLTPSRSTGTTAVVQEQLAVAMLAEPSPPSGVVQPNPSPTVTGDAAAEQAAEPALPAMQQATVVAPPAAGLDPASSGALADLPSVLAPDLAATPATSAGARAADPAPAMAAIELPDAAPANGTSASRSPETAPEPPQPVAADAPADVLPAAPSQDGPMLAAIAGLPPEPLISEPPASTSPVQVPVAQVPFVQAAPQLAPLPTVPDQDGPTGAAMAGLQPEPPAPVPPLPAPAVQAAPQMAGPAVPDHVVPTLAAIAGLPLAPSAAAPSQPATNPQAAPHAAGRRMMALPQYPSAIQTAARTPTPRRLPPRASAPNAEQAATRPAGPGPDLGYCRSIVLRAQLGEDLTHGDRTFMRNGCR